MGLEFNREVMENLLTIPKGGFLLGGSGKMYVLNGTDCKLVFYLQYLFEYLIGLADQFGNINIAWVDGGSFAIIAGRETVELEADDVVGCCRSMAAYVFFSIATEADRNRVGNDPWEYHFVYAQYQFDVINQSRRFEMHIVKRECT